MKTNTLSDIKEGRVRKGGVNDPPTSQRPAPPSGQGGHVFIWAEMIKAQLEREKTWHKK